MLENTLLKLTSEISRNLDIDDTTIDNETVMMDLEKGQYYSLNEVGSRIWQLIENKIKISEIVNTLLNEYDVDKETCEESTLQFIEKLYKDNLIKVIK